MILKQLEYNKRLIGSELSQDEVEKYTQELALCAHAEISSLVNATNYRTHHVHNKPTFDKDTVLFEAIDVIRYMFAILNTWKIDHKTIAEAYKSKDNYLAMQESFKNKEWKGEPVVIVDIDDVLAEFRSSFADWLLINANIRADVESDEYYFISALSKSDENPEVIFETFLQHDGFKDLPVIEGAISFLKDLKSLGYYVQLLTARPKDELRCLYNTYTWLNNNDIPCDAIDFSAEKFRWCAKSKYYDSDKIAFAIDDSPKHAEEYAKHGIKCYVPYKNYNKHLDNDNIYFYHDFYDVLIKENGIV
jgi:phosphoglycolate phosphatase-like HAD superfamily hydrolase